MVSIMFVKLEKLKVLEENKDLPLKIKRPEQFRYDAVRVHPKEGSNTALVTATVIFPAE